MDKIKDQANIVSQLLFSADTGDIYKQAFARTWDIIREVGVLLWLVICLTFVGGEWFYRTAVGLGRSTRAWYAGLSEKDSSTDAQSVTSTGQVLLDTVQTSTAYLLNKARQQLGIPEPAPETPAAPAPPTKPAPSPPPPTSVTPPKPTPAEPPTPLLEDEKTLSDEDDLSD